MSKIIKAAQLRVLLTDDETKIIRSESDDQEREIVLPEGSVLEATQLMEDAKKQADKINEDALKQAKDVIDAAKQEAETIRIHSQEEGWESGYKEGYREGENAAKEEVAKQAASLLRILEESLQAAASQREAAISHLEEDFLKLGLLVAEKIIRKEVAQNPKWLKPVIQEALARIKATDEITIHLHPQDFAELKEGEETFGFRGKIHWESDESLSPGSFFIDTEYGAIDARLEKRLGKLAQGLMDVIYHG